MSSLMYVDGRSLVYTGRRNDFSTTVKAHFRDEMEENSDICHRVSYKFMADAITNAVNYVINWAQTVDIEYRNKGNKAIILEELKFYLEGIILATSLSDDDLKAISDSEAIKVEEIDDISEMKEKFEEIIQVFCDESAEEIFSMILAQIENIKADINYLSPLVSGTLAEQVTPSGDTPASEDEEAQTLLLPENSGDASDSGFMDVILTSETIQKKSEESSSSSASQSSWKVGGWFFSASHNKSSASSSHHVASSEDSSKIEIGFRVMKVSIERGQWFAPNIFKMTQNFYHLSESRCAPGINKDDIRNAISKTDADAQLKKMLSYTVDNKQCNYMLPSYPTAFVIAKDITIRVKISHDEMSENKSYVESQNSTSGGFFGFSASSAGNSKNCSESSYVGVRNNFIYIRIPGPQILGWFQQLVPLDVSEKYMPMEGNPYETVLKKLNSSKEE